MVAGLSPKESHQWSNVFHGSFAKPAASCANCVTARVFVLNLARRCKRQLREKYIVSSVITIITKSKSVPRRRFSHFYSEMTSPESRNNRSIKHQQITAGARAREEVAGRESHLAGNASLRSPPRPRPQTLFLTDWPTNRHALRSNATFRRSRVVTWLRRDGDIQKRDGMRRDCREECKENIKCL